MGQPSGVTLANGSDFDVKARRERYPPSSLLVLAAALSVLLLSFGTRAEARTPALWGGLEPGRHAVGFRILYATDPTRPWLDGTASAPVEGRQGRPVRVSVWYPARTRTNSLPMAYRDYLRLPRAPPSFAKLNAALEARDEASLRRVVKGQRAFAELMATRTAAFRGAAAAAGRFPLIVYPSGLNESGQHANAVLAEYLASHGFVVAAVPQVGTTPARLRLSPNAVDLETQVRDLEFAAAKVRGLPFVQSRWAVVGHSFGGIVALVGQGRNPDLAAVVGLDASYGSSSLEQQLTGSPFFRPERMRIPLLDLRRAEPPASRALLDSLIHSDRYIGELPRIAHGDFTSFPMIASIVPTDIRGRTASDARAGYELVARTVKTFLEAVIKRDGTATGELMRRKSEPRMRWTRSEGLAAPPTEEEIVRTIVSSGRDPALAKYRQVPHPDARRRQASERLILSMGYDFLEPGTDPLLAVKVFSFLTALRPLSADFLDSLAEAQVAAGLRDEARETSRRLLAIVDSDPTLTAEQKAALRQTGERRVRELK